MQAGPHRAQADPAERVPDEHRGAPCPRTVGPPARSLAALQGARLLARSGAHARARQLRRDLLRRRARRLRRLPGKARRGAAQRHADSRRRSDAADPRDGGRHRAPGLRRHGHGRLRAAVSVRAPHVDARPSDERPRSPGTSSPDTWTAPRGGWVSRRSRRTTSATKPRTSTWRSSTGCGREAGRTTRWWPTSARTSSPTPRRCTACASTARTTASTRSTCASRRRSARRCCFRPALPSAAARSPRATPSACSSCRRRSRRRRRSWPTCARAPSRRAARPTTCASSTWPP